MEKVWLAVVLVILLFSLLAAVALRRTKPKESVIYRAIPLLSPAEAQFYAQLLVIYANEAIICPKVRLADLVTVQKASSAGENVAARNRIDRKHVDFVALRTSDYAVFGVIELDDRSHLKEQRSNRDKLVDEILSQAGIPVCRVKARANYDTTKLIAALNAAFTNQAG